jgi:hypothetical protein
MIVDEGYGWGDNMYYAREEGTSITRMAVIDSMAHVEEMLCKYEDVQCVSITTIKGKSGLSVDIIELIVNNRLMYQK